MLAVGDFPADLGECSIDALVELLTTEMIQMLDMIVPKYPVSCDDAPAWNTCGEYELCDGDSSKEVGL